MEPNSSRRAGFGQALGAPRIKGWTGKVCACLCACVHACVSLCVCVHMHACSCVCVLHKCILVSRAIKFIVSLCKQYRGTISSCHKSVIIKHEFLISSALWEGSRIGAK